MRSTDEFSLESPCPSSEDPTAVLVIAPHYVPAFRGGGPIQTLKALIAAAPSEFEISVICGNHDLAETDPLTDQPNQWLPVGRARVCYIQGGLCSLISAYRAATCVNVVYLNSLFNPKYSILPQLMTRLGLWRKATLLVAPRGELDPGALRLKLHKKRLFLKLYRKLGLSNSVLWHASTEEEADHIRAVFGVESQIVVRENETSLPLEAHRRAARAPGIPRLLFASRLSPKKGLLTLLEALAMVSTPTQVEIIGEFDDDKYEARCRDAAQRLPEIISVDFLGALNRERVLLHMRKADVMALPTAGENFGHVIAEAMSESCPVMCSAHTPWTARLSSGGGAVVSPDTPEAWATALREFLAKDPRALHRSSEKVGAVYDTWRNEEKGIHVFQLARDIQRALRV